LRQGAALEQYAAQRSGDYNNPGSKLPKHQHSQINIDPFDRIILQSLLVFLAKDDRAGQILSYRRRAILLEKDVSHPDFTAQKREYS
jgi:hypothetical protein